MVTAEKPGNRVSRITLDKKRAGKPIAGNRHDGFEVAGAGNQLTVRLVRHSQRKRGATDRQNLRSMALALDPTKTIVLLEWVVSHKCTRTSAIDVGTFPQSLSLTDNRSKAFTQSQITHFDASK